MLEKCVNFAERSVMGSRNQAINWEHFRGEVKSNRIQQNGSIFLLKPFLPTGISTGWN